MDRSKVLISHRLRKRLLSAVILLCFNLCFSNTASDSTYSTIYILRTGKLIGSDLNSSVFVANQSPFNLSPGAVVAFKVYSEGEISIQAQLNMGKGNYFCTLQVKRGNDYFVCLTPDDLKQQPKEYVKTFLKKREEEIERREENTDSPINRNSLKYFKAEKGQGTCFLISAEGFLLTNYHCVVNSKNIIVKGIDGDFTTTYGATLIAADLSNDLALLKISNKNLKFNHPPFGIRSNNVSQAEKIFALGYPTAEAMGEEIKITEGIISAKSGVQGDISKFQISAAVNPGNSGGPLIDENGNLLGIIYAKSTIAESAGYAIKAGYVETFLKNIEGFTYPVPVNLLHDKSFLEKIKELKQFVFIVESN